VSVVSLLLALLVLCVVVWAAQNLMRAFNVGDPIRTVILVVLVVVALVWFLSVLGVNTPLRLR
jgi:hypothetical protein